MCKSWMWSGVVEPSSEIRRPREKDKMRPARRMKSGREVARDASWVKKEVWNHGGGTALRRCKVSERRHADALKRGEERPKVCSMERADRVVRSVDGEMERPSCCSRNCSTTTGGDRGGVKEEAKVAIVERRER